MTHKIWIILFFSFKPQSQTCYIYLTFGIVPSVDFDFFKNRSQQNMSPPYVKSSPKNYGVRNIIFWFDKTAEKSLFGDGNDNWKAWSWKARVEVDRPTEVGKWVLMLESFEWSWKASLKLEIKCWNCFWRHFYWWPTSETFQFRKNSPTSLDTFKLERKLSNFSISNYLFQLHTSPKCLMCHPLSIATRYQRTEKLVRLNQAICSMDPWSKQLAQRLAQNRWRME